MNDWELARFVNCDNLVLSGDFNAHDVAWGYSRTDGRGHLLMEHVTAKRLVVYNVVPSLPTYFTSTGIGSWPEVTFSGNADVPMVMDWEVLDDVTGSDHRYVTFRIDSSVLRQKSNRFKTKVSNLSKCSSYLRSNKSRLKALFRYPCDKHKL